ncbi:MAG: hypothetical protein JWN81_308 [Solirubrobacterales bacterium]|jgi:hypothetical protein|nr:hypothetical protein [Solirubrobacterales bacterium]
MGAGGVWAKGGVVVLAMSCFACCPNVASALEPGVHVDPGSPAAKEYALPLNQARQTGSPSQSTSEGTLFGAGIKPPGSGGSTGGGGRRPDTPTTAGGAISAPNGSGESGQRPALAQTILRAARSQGSGSGEGSILALVGGGVAILVLGGFGGTVLRHSRQGTSSP